MKLLSQILDRALSMCRPAWLVFKTGLILSFLYAVSSLILYILSEDTAIYNELACFAGECISYPPLILLITVIASVLIEDISAG